MGSLHGRQRYTSVEATPESIPFYDPDPGSSVGTFLELLRDLLGDALAAEETDDGAVQKDTGGRQRCCPERTIHRPECSWEEVRQCVNTWEY